MEKKVDRVVTPRPVVWIPANGESPVYALIRKQGKVWGAP
jgi:hypothetical protein